MKKKKKKEIKNSREKTRGLAFYISFSPSPDGAGCVFNRTHRVEPLYGNWEILDANSSFERNILNGFARR